MTVSSEVSSVAYAGDGITAIFVIPFYFLEDSHLRVSKVVVSTGVETVLVLNTDFTVTGAGNPAGGSVTVPNEPVVGEQLVILRDVPATQETDYVSNDPFPAESHERALDKLTMLVQQANRENSKAIRVQDFDPVPAKLPAAAERANKIMSFASNGDPIAIIPDTGSAADLAILLASHALFTEGAGMIGLYQQGTVQDALRDSRWIEDFGVTGTANDTAVLHEAFAWLAEENWRELKAFPGRTYIVGPGPTQVIFEGNPYFPTRWDFTDVVGLKIQGNGATFSMDPTLTDTQFNRFLTFFNCTDLHIENFTVDGRLDARTPFGGDAFNGGNELTGNRKSTLQLFDCIRPNVINVIGHRSMMDGIFLGRTTISSTGNLHFNLKTSGGTFCYRQGISNVAGSHGLFDGCICNDTGALGVGKGTLPMGGLDIESDFDNLPNIGNHIRGGQFNRNLTGIITSRAAQHTRIIGAEMINNRGQGWSSSNITTSTTDNWAIFCKFNQLQASTETDTYAVYMGSNRSKLLYSDVRVQDPHRGVVFLNLTQTTNCEVIGNNIEDQGTNGAFNQILLHFTANSQNCRAAGNRLANATGTAGWHVLMESSTGSFNGGNRIASGHGNAGARGLNAIAANEVADNTGSGTRTTDSGESAVFNISSGATLVRRMGPNVDLANSQLGFQTRHVGFDGATKVYTNTAYNLDNVPANSTLQVDFDVTAAGANITPISAVAVGDIVEVDLAVTSSLQMRGRVLNATTVRCWFVNATGVAIDPGATTLQIIVSKRFA